MKQTSGALSLLLSAYRSVFSAAYTKGIAAAVVLTAGLSAGAANAALSTEFATSAAAELPDVVQTGTDIKELKAGENLYANSLTVNGNLTLDMKAEGTGVYIKGDTVISGAEHSLTLSDATWSDDEDVVKAFYGGIYNAGEDGAAGTADDSLVLTGALRVSDGANVTLDKVNAAFTSVSMNGGELSISGKDANLYAYGTGNDLKITTDTPDVSQANVSLSGVDTTVKSGGVIGANNDVIISGTSDVKLNNGRIEASDTVSVTGSKLTSSSAEDKIAADSVVFNQTDVIVNDGATLNLEAESDISVTGGTVTNQGTIEFSGDTNLTGATVSNTGSMVFSKDVDVASSQVAGLFAAVS